MKNIYILILYSLFSIFLFLPKVVYAFDIPIGNGMEWHCYYGREGPNCYDRETEAEKARKEAKRQELQRKLDKETKCKTADDCAVTAKGGCVIKESELSKHLSGLSENDGACICENGPVFFGCIPKKQSDIFKQPAQ